MIGKEEHKIRFDSSIDHVAVTSIQYAQPGNNKAVLTLSSGQSIVLDSTHAGGIARQPGVLNKVSQLAYCGKQDRPGETLYSTIAIGRGGQYQIVLSDGTKVWLDASSSLHYATVFSGKWEVTLTGQAYFEVAHRKKALHRTRYGL